MNTRNLKIKWRMCLGFACLLIIIIIMNVFSIVNLRKTSNLISKLDNGPHVGSLAVSQLTNDISVMESAIKSIIIDKGSSSANDQIFNNALSDAQSQIEKINKISSSNSTETSNIKSYILSLESTYKNINSVSISSHSKNEETIKQTLSQLQQDFISQSDNLEKDSVKKTNRNIFIQDILFVLIVISSIFISFKMAVGITKPVNNLAKGMEHMANGNFDVELNDDFKDELGILSKQLSNTINNIKDYIYDIRYTLNEISNGNISVEIEREYIGEFTEIKTALNKITDYLNNIIIKIQECCSQVYSGTASLSQNAHMLSSNAAEQSQAIESFHKSINRVAYLTEQDGKNAAEVKEISIKSQDVVIYSDEQMQKMLTAMADINSSSQEIANIIKIIDDIAFQTNILALNAAVEAARAGTAGKGFAVVADEVRNLASKSAQAVKNTSGMIDQALNAVKNGKEIADKTANSLHGMRENVESITQLLENIDKSTIEQGKEFSNMIYLLDNITNLIQNNNAASKENSEASEELVEQAHLLNELVKDFKVKK